MNVNGYSFLQSDAGGWPPFESDVLHVDRIGVNLFSSSDSGSNFRFPYRTG